MRFRSVPMLAAIGVAVLASPAAAHYLWVTVDAKKGEHGTVNVYFEGGPSAGDGRYLDVFLKTGSTWVRTVESPKPHKLDIKDVKVDKKRWLSAECTASGPRSIDSYGKFGVYKYPNAEVLLHYYGRLIEVSSQAELNKVARAEQLDLDVAPIANGDKIDLTVYWQGKPLAGQVVSIRGPKGLKINVKSDKAGKASFENKGGRHTLRMLHEIKADGEDGGRKYSIIRHHSTMIVNLPTK